MLRVFAIGLTTAGLALAANIAPFYASSYTLTDLGPVPGVPTAYGGLTFLAGNSNVLLIGGAADSPRGVIDQIGVTRDINGHIIGFSGTGSPYATAPNIDGGLAYGPGDVLFFTKYSANQIGEIKPGSSSPDKTVAAPVLASTGSLGFVPAGFNGAGNFIVGSYTQPSMCVAPLTADGSGTFNIGACGASVALSGAEGIVWAPQGSPLFPSQSVVISEYGSSRVSSYLIDLNGLPILGSRKDFVQNVAGVEGAAIDPVSGDFLFATFGASNHLMLVKGFSAAAPASAPEPATYGMIGTSLVGLSLMVRRKRRSRG